MPSYFLCVVVLSIYTRDLVGADDMNVLELIEAMSLLKMRLRGLLLSVCDFGNLNFHLNQQQTFVESLQITAEEFNSQLVIKIAKKKSLEKIVSFKVS